MRRMLFVDDRFNEWIDILRAEAAEHWDVTPVAGVVEALARLGADDSRFDLILLDLGFPGQQLEGIRAVDAVRTAVPNIPVIILTASNTAADIRTAVDCLKRGAWEYFTKPDVDWASLLAEAEKATQLAKVLKTRFRLLPGLPRPFDMRVMFYMPVTAGHPECEALLHWLEAELGKGATHVHVVAARGIWGGVFDELSLIWVFKTAEVIKAHKHALLQKARELRVALKQEAFAVEIGMELYVFDEKTERIDIARGVDNR